MLDYEKKWRLILEKNPITNVKVGFENKSKDRKNMEKVNNTNLVFNKIEMVAKLDSKFENKQNLVMQEEIKTNTEEIDLSDIPELD